MKTPLIAALLVAVSAAVTAPAFAGVETSPSGASVTRAQVRAELVELHKSGYQPGRANDPHYPDEAIFAHPPKTENLPQTLYWQGIAGIK
ncbi:DUF4148 domain-containing protein, partial [Burkholderia ubonensis]|uniref:DUF4148 domain-containing protein n=1 Tax=Burkholderia ubonensis TaxID=101571 RepID=UPI000AD58EA8